MWLPQSLGVGRHHASWHRVDFHFERRGPPPDTHCWRARPPPGDTCGASYCCHWLLRVVCSRRMAHPTVSTSSFFTGVGGLLSVGKGTAARPPSSLIPRPCSPFPRLPPSPLTAATALPSARTKSPEHSPMRLHAVYASPTVLSGLISRQSRRGGGGVGSSIAAAWVGAGAVVPSPLPAANGARVVRLLTRDDHARSSEAPRVKGLGLEECGPKPWLVKSLRCSPAHRVDESG